MSDSIYAPPQADVSVSDDAQPRYYVVAPYKFVLLSVLTFTLYFVYWFYRNWRQIKLDDNDDLWAPARGLFYIFFTHSLFTDVQENLRNQDRSYEWQPGLLAGLFVIATLVVNLFDRIVSFEAYPVVSVMAPFVATALTTLLLFPAQKAINYACNDVGGSGNSKLTVINWAWIVLGGLFWALVVIGTVAILSES